MRDRDLWLGLHRDANTWAWYDDTPLSWLNWDDGEPGEDGDCGRFQPTDGTWASQGCGTALRYVCERGMPAAIISAQCEIKHICQLLAC